MKWNRNAKTTQTKANDRGTKTENAENLKPTGECSKTYENCRETQELIQKPQFSLKSHSNNRPQML